MERVAPSARVRQATPQARGARARYALACRRTLAVGTGVSDLKLWCDMNYADSRSREQRPLRRACPVRSLLLGALFLSGRLSLRPDVLPPFCRAADCQKPRERGGGTAAHQKTMSDGAANEGQGGDGKSSGGSQKVDIRSLSWDQLNQLHQSLQTEIQSITQSYGSLRLAVGRFKSSDDFVSTIEKSSPQAEILVPLTSSLYIPGKISDVKNVMVEVGGKFYVEKDIPEARKFLERKIAGLQKNITQVGEVLGRKNQEIQMVNAVRQAKAQQQIAAMREQKKGLAA